MVHYCVKLMFSCFFSSSFLFSLVCSCLMMFIQNNVLFWLLNPKYWIDEYPDLLERSYFFMLLTFWFIPSWRCSIKTVLKHGDQTIFQGGSPGATLIPNSMIVVWVLYRVQLFLDERCPKLLSLFLCYSFFLSVLAPFYLISQNV